MTFSYQIFQNVFKTIDTKFTYTLQIKHENQQFSAKHHNFSDTDIRLFQYLALMGLFKRKARLGTENEDT